MWFLTNNFDSHSIEWAVYNAYKHQGSETVQYRLEIIFKIVIKIANFHIHRLFADVLNDASILVEMLAPLFKAYFTVLACVSSISKV